MGMQGILHLQWLSLSIRRGSDSHVHYHQDTGSTPAWLEVLIDGAVVLHADLTSMPFEVLADSWGQENKAKRTEPTRTGTSDSATLGDARLTCGAQPPRELPSRDVRFSYARS